VDRNIEVRNENKTKPLCLSKIDSENIYKRKQKKIKKNNGWPLEIKT
jgi:hypothetical protein